MKRAQISSQFNWIFILIIGVVIISFFVSIVAKQKDQADTKISINVVTSFKTILQSSLVKEKATQQISMPKQTLEFYCELDTCTEHGCYSGYRVDGSTLDVSSDLMSIFSPRKISGGKLITYSLDWNFPFKVLNFLFVTTDDVRYIFVKDANNYYSDILSRFPDNLTIDVVNVSDIPSLIDEGFYNVRYIFINDEGALQDSLLLDSYVGKNSKNVSAININYNPSEANHGSVDYFVNNDDVKIKIGEIFFIDNATLMAAIFSEDPEIYTCNLIKAFNRFGRLASIYEAKLNELFVEYDQDFLTCGSVLYSSVPAKTMRTKALEVVSKQDIGEEDANSLYSASNSLTAINKRARDYSCPVIY